MSDNGKAGLSSMQFKTIGGLKLRYATGGKKDGDPILLLSPWPESIYAFLPTWDTFSELGPLVAVDIPGFGLSQSRPDVMAPEAMGEFILRMVDAFGLNRPHAIGPDVGTPALLFAAANHPGSFKSLVIGSGATDHTHIGGILDELVNAPSLEPYKDLTGEQFVQGAIENQKSYKLPDYALADYLAAYAGDRFFESVQFVRDYPRALPRLASRLGEITVRARSLWGGTIHSSRSRTPKACIEVCRTAS
jgi:pimeloyl-ACP methyl ester carboxylesterase